MDHLDIELILDNIPWDKIQGKRVLMTGGTGFVGTWMGALPNVHITRLNQMQYEFSRWDAMEWDYIVHLAPPPATSERVIACAKRCGAAVLYASSGAVYDRNPGDYAKSKMTEERRLLDSGIDVKIARMFAFAGPHMPNKFALINYIWDGIAGGPIKIRGDNVIRSYLYAADMAVWMWRVLLDGEPRQTYEVGSTIPVTMERLAHEVAANFECCPEVIYERMYGPDARPVYVPDSTATMLSLGLREYTSFKDAIRKTVDWYRGEVEL